MTLFPYDFKEILGQRKCRAMDFGIVITRLDPAGREPLFQRTDICMA
jgi:hypothetical protein